VPVDKSRQAFFYWRSVKRGDDVKIVVRLFAVLLFVISTVAAQGTYYNVIDTTSASFVTDLHNLIYPHTRIYYDNFDETNIANFASRDTTGGQKVVTCIYSGENYVYTPPFTWTTYSREHTWCQSWMPTKDTSGFTSRPEYSDQHHLYPANQNKANGVRSNHPLGIVANVSSSYLQCKLGTNEQGYTVFEPRPSHKGDAARALLYMAVCYHGYGGHDWTFNHLNTVILPGQSVPEGPQDVNMLLLWSQEDPPDAWEIARNEYVYSLQNNRNPFIDHPSWVNLIDFNTLTKIGATTFAVEPTNYATAFTCSVLGNTSLQISWTDADVGSQAPLGYLLLANMTNSFTPPIDGVTYTDNPSLAGGSAVVNIAYSAVDTYSFTGLTAGTNYYFRLYSYNGTGSQINYKTNGSVPSASGITTGDPPTGTLSANDVLITNYSPRYNTASDEFIVLFNNTSTAIDINGFEIAYSSSNGSTPIAKKQFTTSTIIPARSYYLLSSNTSVSVGSVTNQTSDATFSVGFADDGQLAFRKTSGGSVVFALATGTITSYSFGLTTSHSITTSSSSQDEFVLTPSGNTYLRSGNNNTDYSIVSSSSITQVPNSSSASLSVQLNSFAVTKEHSGAILTWMTATELNNYGFEVERRKVDESTQLLNGSTAQWLTIGFVSGSGTSNAPHQYLFADQSLPAGWYAYRLKQIDQDGAWKYSQSVEVEIGSPRKFMLSQNYPNPFNPATMIRFTVPESGNVKLRVFDILGRQVAELFNNLVEAGQIREVPFDGTRLASGVYFYSLEFGAQRLTRHMVLVR